MALSQKHRSSIYQGLSEFLGEEEVEALLSHFPARDLDEPVTKEFVRAEIADLRVEMHAGFGSIRAEMNDRFREMTMWMAGSLVAGMGVAVGIASALG